MKKGIRKFIAGILTAACVMSLSAPVMAEDAKPQVFVSFICGVNTTGKYVTAGSNVTAPTVPLYGGFTFCGFDKSLYNVTENTTYNAIYLPDNMGEEAIKAKKATLATPAISATSVADPNAPLATLDAAAALDVAQSAVSAASASVANQQTALLSLLQAQQAAANAGAAAVQPAAAPAPAAQAPAASTSSNTAAQTATAPAAAAPAATAPATQSTPAADTQTAAAPAASTDTQAAADTTVAQATTAVTAASGLPSWAVSLYGVDASGVAEVYKYWKTVKNADDATIQANWGALLNHYAGHGTQGW